MTATALRRPPEGAPVVDESRLDRACDMYRRLIGADPTRAARYELTKPDWSRAYVDLLFRAGRSHAGLAERISRVHGGRLEGLRIAEVGCGFGRMAIELAYRGARVVGVEVGREYLEIADTLAGAFGSGQGLRLVCGCAEALPLPSDAFDFVWSDQTIEHVRDVPAALSEMVRVLRPGGLLMVRCPNYLRPWMREPHLAVPWPPFLPRPCYRRLIRLSYGRRGRELASRMALPDARRLVEEATRGALAEMASLNFLTPQQVASYLRRLEGVDWRHVRAVGATHAGLAKRPLAWLFRALHLDTLVAGAILVAATKDDAHGARSLARVDRLWHLQ